MGRDRGRPSCLCQSPLRQASERQISSLRWELGTAFQNPWKPDLPCLSGFLLMTLSWVGSRELAFLKTPENLICLAHQVFSPMAFLGIGSHVLAPGSLYRYKKRSEHRTEMEKNMHVEEMMWRGTECHVNMNADTGLRCLHAKMPMISSKPWEARRDLEIRLPLWILERTNSANRDPPGGASGKEPPCQCRRHGRHRFDPWVRKMP